MLNKEMLQETINQVKELCSLLQSLHPIKVLSRVYWEFIFQNSGIKTESEIGTKEVHSRFLIEYLQSLFIAIDLKHPLKTPNDNEWGEIKQKAIQIYDVCRIAPPFVMNTDHKTTLQEEDILLFFKIFASWFIRGKRYAIHEYEHLNSLLSPHDQILKTLYRANAQDIAEGIKKISINFSLSLNYFQEYGNELKQFHPLYKTLQEQQLSVEKNKESLQNKIRESGLKEKIEKLGNKLFKEDLFDVEKITGWPKILVKKLSASIGSNKDFLINGKYPGTPLQQPPVMEKPFLEYNSKFYLFNPYIVQDNLYRNIQSSVLADKPDYLEKWTKIQTDVSEDLPFEMLEQIIGQHEQVKNFQYKIKDDNGNSFWVECDGIILFEEWLFVVEVKSGKMSNRPSAQNVVSHFRSIKKLLAEPAEQGRRFIESLKKEKTLTLYDKKKRNIVKTISIHDFKQSIVMAVSLEQLTDISPQVQHFKQLGLDIEGEAVLCISIDDLRVYRDLSNGVIEFFHFLIERKKAFYNQKLTLDDELDHFGMYLTHNQYHNITKDMSKSNLNIFVGYRDEIDRYLGMLFLDTENAKKPKQNIPFFLTAIIENLELNRKPGFVKVGIVIYAFSKETKDKTNNFFLEMISLQHKERKIKPSCFIWETYEGDLSVSVIIRIPNIPLNFKPTDYAITNMFIQEKEKVLLLDISVDEEDKVKDVSFEWIKRTNLSIEEINQYKREAKEFAEFRFSNQIKLRDKKKIGRNEKCPCGSGKKYKKCHGK